MNYRRFTSRGAALALGGLLAIANANAAGAAATANEARPNPRNFASVTKGAKLFQQNCAACHQAQAQGDANWRTPGPDGKFRPPPLNGTGHMWHHPLPVLLNIMREGTLAQGGAMPAWKETLTEAEMVDIIAWLQSKWPGEIYQQWQQMDARAAARR